MEKAHHSRRLPDHPAFHAPPKRHARQLFMQAMVWVVLLGVGGVWVYAWQNGRAHRLQEQVDQLQYQLYTAPQVWAQNQHHDDPRSGVIGLGPSASLTLPPGWELQPNGVDCPRPQGPLRCLDRHVLGLKSSGAAQLSVDVTLYRNPDDLYAKDWFLNVYGANVLSGPGSTIEERAIHGRSAVYAVLRTDAAQDVYYVVNAAGQAAVVHARLFTANSSEGDFRSAAPAVAVLANGLQFGDGYE